MKSLRQLLFPRDPLLPGSRLQNMKALLQMTGELRVIPAAKISLAIQYHDDILISDLRSSAQTVRAPE